MESPLPEFIAGLYQKRFGRAHPDNIRSLEQLIADQSQKKAARKAGKQPAMAIPAHPAQLPFGNPAEVEGQND